MKSLERIRSSVVHSVEEGALSSFRGWSEEMRALLSEETCIFESCFEIRVGY